MGYTIRVTQTDKYIICAKKRQGMKMGENKVSENVCACCHYKNTPRDAKERKQLQNRINRIVGQLNGIGNMIEDNRYCGDILIQIAAVESALQNLGYVVLKDHLETCVAEEVQKGNIEIMEEAIELIKKLK